MITTIAWREFRTLFLSPLAWSILGVVNFILAYLFLAQIDTFLMLAPRLAALPNAPGVTDIVVAPTLGSAAIVLLLVVPLVTMRVFAEERRSRTLGLLFSAPLSMTQIVLGKYLALLAFFAVMLVLIAALPLSLLVGTELDLGKLAAGLIGLYLLLAAFAAAGLFMSAVTDQPTVAAVGTFGLLLGLWILDWAGQGEGSRTTELFGYLSLFNHYQSLLKGLFNSADVIYYLLFVLGFLALTIKRLDAQRLPH